jgi:hypothetical protein
MFMAVPAALILLAAHAAARASYTSDEELTARFLSHESDFQSLVQSLDSDCRRMPPGAESCELGDLAPAGTDTARVEDYRRLLAKISATNFRYFPESGDLILPVSNSGQRFAEAGRFYLYLNHEERAHLLVHRRLRQSYGWRGPAIYFIAGDHRIKGRWFLHYDQTVVAAFPAY